MQRRKRIKDVCKQYAETIGSWDPSSFKGRSPLYSEQIRRDAFLIASLPPTILCYNHKAKSLETQFYGIPNVTAVYQRLKSKYECTYLEAFENEVLQLYFQASFFELSHFSITVSLNPIYVKKGCVFNLDVHNVKTPWRFRILFKIGAIWSLLQVSQQKRSIDQKSGGGSFLQVEFENAT